MKEIVSATNEYMLPHRKNTHHQSGPIDQQINERTLLDLTVVPIAVPANGRIVILLASLFITAGAATATASVSASSSSSLRLSRRNSFALSGDSYLDCLLRCRLLPLLLLPALLRGLLDDNAALSLDACSTSVKRSVLVGLWLKGETRRSAATENTGDVDVAAAAAATAADSCGGGGPAGAPDDAAAAAACCRRSSSSGPVMLLCH